MKEGYLRVLETMMHAARLFLQERSRTPITSVTWGEGLPSTVRTWGYRSKSNQQSLWQGTGR
jgi:hypothetical protein